MEVKWPIFLVDDDAAVRDALSLYLEGSGFDVRTFDSAESFLGEIDNMGRGVLVLDQRMTGLSGLELQSELKMRGVDLPTIFITGHGDVPMSVRAMKEGATDFLEKPFKEEDLLDRVSKALLANGRRRQGSAETSAIARRFESLTPRERQVLELVVRGHANKVVASRLGASRRTIEIHRAHVMRKMQASSLAQLVRMVMRLEASRGT